MLGTLRQGNWYTVLFINALIIVCEWQVIKKFYQTNKEQLTTNIKHLRQQSSLLQEKKRREPSLKTLWKYRRTPLLGEIGREVQAYKGYHEILMEDKTKFFIEMLKTSELMRFNGYNCWSFDIFCSSIDFTFDVSFFIVDWYMAMPLVYGFALLFWLLCFLNFLLVLAFYVLGVMAIGWGKRKTNGASEELSGTQ